MKDKDTKPAMSHISDDAAAGVSINHMSVDVEKLDAVKPDYNEILLLPTRNLVMFPGVNLSLGLGREVSKAVARYAEKHSAVVGIVCQRDPDVDEPDESDLYSYGILANVLKVIDMNESEHTALLRGLKTFRIRKVTPWSRIPGALVAQAEPVHEPVPRRSNIEFDVLAQNIRQTAEEILHKVFDDNPPFRPSDLKDPVEMINVVATNIPLPTEEKARMLAAHQMMKRGMLLLASLDRYNQRMDVSAEIAQRTRSNMDQQQRNAFLQQQLETIREELYGDDENDIDRFIEKAAELDLPEQADETVRREIEKLRRLNPSSPDYQVEYSYLENLLALPWGKYSTPNDNFEKAEKILEEDHYGLEKVKERIIEQVALIMDNPGGKAPILCLVGPPGVGKTSLGASIASALGRNYQRVALGGLHDEAEIRGHRRTYIGAMPGRIVDAMKRAKTANPVLLLDEIDKIGADYKGDPAAALLEVLDPEQNCHFHDNYIDIDFDLSKVLFIATANSLQTVSKPLLDRIEVIEMSGYTVEEKVEIARRHLLKNILKAQGWKEDELEFTPEALRGIIEDYTAESGVRQLEKKLAAVLRKAVLARRRGKGFPQPVTREMLGDLLGNPPYRRDLCPENPVPGVVTGLAWTQVGGEILLVEVSLAKAKTGGKLTLTGNLGDVMKESAQIALQWVKANAGKLSIDPEMFETHNVHLHFPEGAIPKDGPSAGITMATALVSAFTGRPARGKLAMTGEITLRGQVLPVGGIREKILAAKRSGATDIILCSENRRDVEEIDASYLKGLTFHYVDSVCEVLETAFRS